MQIDDQHLETGVLPAFISRHDYKDNHDVIKDDSSSVSANFPGKPVCECRGMYREIDDREPTREEFRLGHTALARSKATM